ncbi:MAG: outer membrane beta-barrel protein [Minwuia sp.]|nr:outer membrane beta-barrel protein [Minwuia sp.]
MNQRRTGFRRTALAVVLLLCPALAFFAQGVSAQGASDTETEGQVRAQIIQNPIIPATADPEPSFTTAKQDAVLQRARREYNAIGFEAGGLFLDVEHLGRGQPFESFLIFPKVDIGLTFDDNIFATNGGEKADFIGSVAPSVRLVSNWDNHEVFAEGSARFSRHLSNGAENSREHGFATGGKLEISEFESVKLRLGFDRKIAPRGDAINNVGGDEPSVRYEYGLAGTWEYKRDKFLWRAKGAAQRKDFVDTPAGAGEIEADRNDSWEFGGAVRIGWEEWEGTTLFIEPGVKTVVHDLQFDGAGVERDFSSATALVGFTYDLTAVTFLEGAIGLGYATFADRNSSNLLFLDGKLDFVWNPHDSWTFLAGYERNVQSTTAITNVNGVNVPDTAIITHELSVGAQLEITYELLAGMKTSFAHTSSISGNTVDDVFNNELSLLWLMNENMRLRGFWDFTNFGSTDANRQFLRNRLGVVLTLHY